MVLPSLMVLNAMDSESFGQALGGVFEHSSWIPIAAHAARPFNSIGELHAAMVNVVYQCDSERQLALLRAHPMLAKRGELTEASQAEQGGMGLDRLEAAEAEAFQALNAEYQERFGFPFIIAVRGQPDRATILAALKSRMSNGADRERAAALAEVFKIARFRLDDLVGA
jgi:2-oxo-4-hydroxy-4-carboxy-5-ureidoimidazoline decarboxylase